MKRVLIDVTFGVALLCILLLGLESGLKALGVGDPTGATNWSRGFDPSASYLLPNPEVEGGYITQFQFKSGGERKIAPRGERKRVLLFGGSNTQGFPTSHLQAELGRLSGQRGTWEVINLGRSGYGSTRVRIIFEQALELLDPDLVVLYMGHNEFVERGFEMDLDVGDLLSQSGPEQLVRSTRLYRAFANHYGAKPKPKTEGPSSGAKPEAWKWEYEKFDDITYDETQVQMNTYKENVRAMCKLARERGVAVLVSSIVFNRLSVPFSSTFSDSVSTEDRERFEALHAKAQGHLPTFLFPLLPASDSERVHGFDFGRPGKFPAGKAYGNDVLKGSRELSGRMQGRSLMLLKESGWAPKVRSLGEALLRFHTRDISQAEQVEIEAAEKSLLEALALVPDHPHALFELALCETLLGRPEAQIHRHLEQAASLDRAPRKGSDMQNQLLHEAASGVDGVVFCDVDGQLEECMPMKITAWEAMVDHCHLGMGARRVVLEILAEAILESWPKGAFQGGQGL